jgi:hypothetical protein
VVKQLRQLRQLVPPRVSAAVLSTIFNRWTTARRMRHSRRSDTTCLLGCSPTAADSIEHYVNCPIWHRWQKARLGDRLEQTILAHIMLATPMKKTRISLQAAGVYVLYRTVNHLRHQPPMPQDRRNEYVWHYMHQTLHEAIKGHASLTQQVVGSSGKKRKRAPRTLTAPRKLRRRN